MTLRILTMSLVAFACGDLVSQEVGSLRQAFESLNQAPNWNHVNPDLIDRVAASAVHGPALNVSVEVGTADGAPVVGAVVAIQESIREASSTADLLSEPYQSIRGLAVTDAVGRCRLTDVKTTGPVPGRPGRVQSFLVIAHPQHGFDFHPLLRTSRAQQAKVKMRKQVAQMIKVSDRLQPSAVRLTRVAEHATARYRTGFDAHEIFGPRANVDASGTAIFARLPQGLYTGFAVQCENLWTHARMQSLVEIDGIQKSIDGAEVDVRLPIRFVDTASRRTVSGVTVDRWRRPEQLSGDDGLLVIRPASPPLMHDAQRDVRLSFVVEPPADWVRERILEYPFRLRSATTPQSFALTRSTPVRGRVVNSHTGIGVAGVIVQSQRPVVRPGGVKSTYHSTAVTDSVGEFILAAPPGRQRVSIAAPIEGFLPLKEQRLAIVPGQAIADLELELTPASPIRGRIVNDQGEAVSGVEIICHSGDRLNQFRDGLPLDATITTARTDDDGRFAIQRPPGKYESLMIKGIAEDGRQTRDAVFAFDPTHNRPPKVDLELSLGQNPRSVELVGVLLKEGKPWSGAVVTAAPSGPKERKGNTTSFRMSLRGQSQLGQATTDDQGRYRMAIEIGDHSVVWLSVSSTPFRRRVSLDASRIEVPAIDVRERIGNKTIRGMVVDPLGNPVESVTVVATNQRDVRIDRKRPKDDPHRSTTNARGEFVLRELFDGPVNVQVRPKGIPPEYAVGADVSVPTGDEGLQIVFDPSLSRIPPWIEPAATRPLTQFPELKVVTDSGTDGAGVSIRGMVTDQNDTPLWDATVRVFCVTSTHRIATGNPLHHPACRLLVKTDSQGRFTVGPFPSGSQVRIVAGARMMSARLSKFLLPGQADSDVVIKLTRFDHEVPSMQTSHQLIDHEGNPVPAALVMTSYQAFSDIIDLSSDQSPSVLTDDEGYFRFPTTFDVDYKTIAAFPVAGPACVIRNQYGERKYRLADPMSIRGHVTDAVGRAIPRMVMRVQNDRLPSVVRVVTAKDGSFQVDGLPCSETSHLSGTRHLAPRYFLWRHRFAPAIREVIDLGNLHAVPSRDLTVRVVPSSNAALPPTLTVTAGSKNAAIDEQGEVQFQAVAPITRIRLDGSVSVARTDPPLQRVWGENAFAVDTDSVDSIVLYLD